MKVGIDALSFYSSNYFLDLADLAKERNIDIAKFYAGLGQRKMAVAPPNEDVVTLAAHAAEKLLQDIDRNSIETILFATESGIDFSKSAGIYLHHLLNLPMRCRVVELKQACYSATAGLQLGMALLQQNPTKKILLVASDIARYAMNSAGESSQGSGAMAMLLSANPRLLEILPEAGFATKDAMDFWRPNYCSVPFVDGRYSCDLYMHLCEETWKQYSELSQRNFSAHQHFCYHTPVPKLVEKTHRRLVLHNLPNGITAEEFDSQVGLALIYSREVGNCYTASLYLGILSLLENSSVDLSNRLLGLYSYGSGCSGEFFAARVVPNYQQTLPKEKLRHFLNLRQQLSYQEYENFGNFKLPTDTGNFSLPQYKTGNFSLAAIEQHKRIYTRVV